MDRRAGYRNALREAVEKKRIEVVQAIVLHERFDPENVFAVQCDGRFLRTVMQFCMSYGNGRWFRIAYRNS